MWSKWIDSWKTWGLAWQWQRACFKSLHPTIYVCVVIAYPQHKYPFHAFTIHSEATKLPWMVSFEIIVSNIFHLFNAHHRTILLIWRSKLMPKPIIALWHGNAFYSTGHRSPIHLDVLFAASLTRLFVEQTFNLPLMWDVMTLMGRHCNTNLNMCVVTVCLRPTFSDCWCICEGCSVYEKWIC